MKVREIHVKDYQQFKDLRLDLTYPTGHAKAGQPLDKICIIGQSGTGKTTLLRLLQACTNWKEVIIRDNVMDSLYLPDFNWCETSVVFVNESSTIKSIIEFSTGRLELIFNRTKISNYRKSSVETEAIYGHLIALPIKNIFIPADIIHKYKEVEDSEKLAAVEELQKDFIDFENVSLNGLWQVLIKDIQQYQEEEIQQRLKLADIAQTSSPEDITIAAQTLQKWLANAPNPIKDVAENCLDKILNIFQLRVRQKLDFKSKNDIGFIKIETLNGEEVPNGLLSTGTKQVISTALPLYTLKPKGAVILFDEPERSLYPDIQTEIVDFYTSLTTDCQFFFATHSPLVAASFEPWEVVELKFDHQSGSVFQEQYYKGERHVDNYFINPQLLSWDGILQRVFDIDKSGNPKRATALNKLARLKKALEKNSISANERAIKWQEYSQLAKELNWDFEESEQK
jgi:ABC-type lipoprotein export system ATPase subunit